MDFLIRTEDIQPDEIFDLFVETTQDRSIISGLKSRNPVIVEGGRGVGKSFLLRVAEAELTREFDEKRVFPVYLTFNRSSLIHTADRQQFSHWMLARICSRIIRALRKHGQLGSIPSSLSIIAGGVLPKPTSDSTKIEEIAEAFENSWQTPGQSVDVSGLPTVEKFKDSIEDICDELNISRFVIFIDEAAHIFLPEQQRQFFTLFRDIRSPYITCNAAVYPGVTSYGDTFQKTHDSTLMTLDRDVLSEQYVSAMREIVIKQSGDSEVTKSISRYGENFSILAYASSGNPRILLKTIAKAKKLNSTQVNEVIREYYRTEVWAEHSLLAGTYSGHIPLIDWGRNFIEKIVLPDLKEKNDKSISSEKNTSCFFWIHRDAPQQVKEALRLLSYTGIVKEHSTGIKASRGEIGTRYVVNLGCLFALEPIPAKTAFEIAKSLSIKRMSEFGADHSSYADLLRSIPAFTDPNMTDVLKKQLVKPVDVLDIPDWQKERLAELNIKTIDEILRASETTLMSGHYIGEKRARRMKNAAVAAVCEYLSG